MKGKELVVLRFSSLGDVAMMVPVLLSFHAKYPQEKVTVISRSNFQPIFRQLSFVNFLPIENKNGKIGYVELLSYSIRFFKFRGYVIIDLHDVIRSKTLCLFYRLGFNKIRLIEKGREEKRAVIKNKGKQFIQVKSSHERYRDVFERAGYRFNLLPDAYLQKKSPSEKNKFYVGIAPFARFASKEYNVDKWKQVLVELSHNPSIKIFLFGYGSREKLLADEMVKNLQNVEVLIGQVSFAQELECISQLDSMVAMDSGNGHLAAMYGIPVLTLWGSTHPCMGYAPYPNPLHRSLFPDKKMYPHLPVSVFGKCNDAYYVKAIDSIAPQDIVKSVFEMAGSKLLEKELQ